LDAGSVLSLRGGGQHIVLNPDGIFSSVIIEQGGAPIIPAIEGLLEEAAAAPEAFHLFSQ
ncbi:hypothetical protein NNO07_27585, partial [Pseudomonas resinovorans]